MSPANIWIDIWLNFRIGLTAGLNTVGQPSLTVWCPLAAPHKQSHIANWLLI